MRFAEQSVLWVAGCVPGAGITWSAVITQHGQRRAAPAPQTTRLPEEGKSILHFLQTEEHTGTITQNHLTHSDRQAAQNVFDQI